MPAQALLCDGVLTKTNCAGIRILSEFAFCLGHVVAQLVAALRYKPESCGFDSRWCHWTPMVYSASNIN